MNTHIWILLLTVPHETKNQFIAAWLNYPTIKQLEPYVIKAPNLLHLHTHGTLTEHIDNQYILMHYKLEIE